MTKNAITPSTLRTVSIWTALVVLLTIAASVSGMFSGGTLAPSADALTPQLVPANYTPDPSAVQNFLGSYYPDGSDERSLLPAYRWNSSLEMYSNSGFFDAAVSGVVNGITGIFFAISSFIWLIILEVMGFAIGSEVLGSGPAVEAMNNASSTLFSSVTSSGLLFLVLAIVLVSAMLAILRMRSLSALRMIGLAIVVIATMQFVFTAAAGGSDGQSPPRGSPAWIAQTSTKTINDVMANLSTGFGLTTEFNRDNIGPRGPNPEYNCKTYTTFLYSSYAQATSDNAGKLPLQAVSVMWENAYLSYFTTAQYGSDTPMRGARSICHQGDALSVSASEAHSIMSNVYSPAPGKEVANIQPQGDRKAYEANLFMWQACQVKSDGKIGASPGWAQFHDFGDDNCREWWEGGIGNALQWGDAPQLVGDAQDGRESLAAGDIAGERAVDAAEDSVTSFWGKNYGQRVAYGLLSAVVSGVYAYSLIPLSLGTLISEFGLILMMMLLPLTLLLLALGATNSGSSGMGSRAKDIGVRMIRLTAAFAAAKAVLTFLLFVLIQFMVITQNIVSTIPGVSTLLMAFVPLIAIFLLRYILKKIGLGNLTSLGGAAELTAAAGMKAVADKKDSRSMFGKDSKFGKRTKDRERNAKDRRDRLGMEKLNKLGNKAKEKTKQVAKATPKKAGAGALAGLVGIAAGVQRQQRKLRGIDVSDQPTAAQVAKRVANAPGRYFGSKLKGFRDGTKPQMLDGLLNGAPPTVKTPSDVQKAVRQASAKEQLDGEKLKRDGAVQIGTDEYGNPVFRKIPTLQRGKTAVKAERFAGVTDTYLESLPAEQKEAFQTVLAREELKEGHAGNYLNHEGVPYSKENLIASENGRVHVIPQFAKDGSRVIPEATSEAAMISYWSDPVSHLPKEVFERMDPQWSEKEKCDYLEMHALEMGWMNDDGSYNDVMNLVYGTPITSSEAKQEMYRANEGDRKSVLMKVGTAVAVDAAVTAAVKRTMSYRKEVERDLGAFHLDAWAGLNQDYVKQAREQVETHQENYTANVRHVENSLATYVDKAQNGLQSVTFTDQRIGHLQSASAGFEQVLAHPGSQQEAKAAQSRLDSIRDEISKLAAQKSQILEEIDTAKRDFLSAASIALDRAAVAQAKEGELLLRSKEQIITANHFNDGALPRDVEVELQRLAEENGEVRVHQAQQMEKLKDEILYSMEFASPEESKTMWQDFLQSREEQHSQVLAAVNEQDRNNRFKLTRARTNRNLLKDELRTLPTGV